MEIFSMLWKFWLPQRQWPCCISQLRITSVGHGGIIWWLVGSGFNRCILMNSDSALFSGSFTNSYRTVTMILIAPTWTGKNVRLLVNRRLYVKEGVGRVAGTDALVRRHRMSTTALNCERLLTAVVSLGASHHRPSPALALPRTPSSLPRHHQYSS